LRKHLSFLLAESTEMRKQSGFLRKHLSFLLAESTEMRKQSGFLRKHLSKMRKHLSILLIKFDFNLFFR
jgi:hypothetical protein